MYCDLSLLLYLTYFGTYVCFNIVYMFVRHLYIPYIRISGNYKVIWFKYVR